LYIFLSRTGENIGDYLYNSNSIKLINRFKPNIKIIEVTAWKPLMKQIDVKTLKKSKAIIIFGGPALRKNLFPQLYPLPSIVFKNKIPVIFLGIGSKIYPGTIKKLKKLKLTQSTIKFLKYSIDQGYPIGVRDILSKKLLLENGIEHVVVNGCSAWYDLDYLGKKLKKPKEIKKIVFSTPAKPLSFNQAKKIIKKLRKEFPKASITVSFHHGINFGEGRTFRRLTKLNQDLANFSIKHGCKILDLSKSLKDLRIYDNSDLHLGYRVHGHLYALSHRKPSFLIAEDSRGTGALKTLGGLGVPIWSKYAEILSANKILWKGIRYWLKNIGPYFPISSLVSNQFVPKLILKMIKSELDNGFKSFEKIPDTIDKTFENRMKKFIKSLP
jgi:hypothetical protein